MSLISMTSTMKDAAAGWWKRFGQMRNEASRNRHAGSGARPDRPRIWRKFRPISPLDDRRCQAAAAACVAKKPRGATGGTGRVDEPQPARLPVPPPTGKLTGVSASTSHNAIERIHASGHQLVLSVTGGGSGAIAALLEVPGASATVLEAVVPYAAAALEQWLGGPADHSCSERTARAMAMAAFERARTLSHADPRTLRGIGATASLATTRPKRGAHRVHVAWQSAEFTAVASCELTKGERTRAEEEQVATRLVLDAVAEACGVDAPSLLEASLRAGVQRRSQQASAPWSELLLGERSFCAIGENDATETTILFPGAFNPLHAGHERMAELAAERYGVPVTFELSILNVDKPPMDFVEIADRLQALSDRRVLLTRAATFVEKAELAPGCTFVVGVDTLTRIADPKYYGGDAAARDEAIAAITRQGCRFLVFGRLLEGRFSTSADLEVPTPLRALCDEVSETEFRADVSSTELRGG
jgi:nicotinamide mononucleotide (NMN) deamidase PncC